MWYGYVYCNIYIYVYIIVVCVRVDLCTPLLPHDCSLCSFQRADSPVHPSSLDQKKSIEPGLEPELLNELHDFRGFTALRE